MRAQGLPAFFHHDDDRRMSMVTVGLFGEDAYDAKTTLYSDEVMAIKKRFPKLKVNGEDLLKPIRKGSQEDCMLHAFFSNRNFGYMNFSTKVKSSVRFFL